MNFSARTIPLQGLQVVVLGFILLAGCSNDLASNSKSGDGGVIPRTAEELCDSLSSPPAECGQSICAADNNCAMGMFCFDSTCAAICTASEGCASDEQCTARGRCEQVLLDGGVVDSGGCDPTNVTPARIRPNVMFIVDASGSMQWSLAANDTFPGPGEKSRWEAEHDAISQVVGDNADIANFGLMTYTLSSELIATEVNTEFNLMDIQDDHPNYSRSHTPVGGTPTGAAIDYMTQRLDPMSPMPIVPPGDGSTIYLLTTDGQPADESAAVSAVQAAFADTYKTFVLKIGPTTSAITSHFNRMANAGVGMPPDTIPAAKFWTADTVGELEARFAEIVAAQIPCDVVLNKEVNDGADICDGTVTLNGDVLTCGTDYGLKAGTNNVLELRGTNVGEACHTWKNDANATLEAVFQCGVIVE